MRKAFVIVVLFGGIILLAYYLSRPKPLRPFVFTWQEVGRVHGFVDLDADGNDELLVLDERWHEMGQIWWVQFRPTVPVRQKIPVPKWPYWDIPNQAQLLTFRHLETDQVFLVARQGEQWLVKQLGKLDDFPKVKDADFDGQVNDVVVWSGQKRTVFSRLKDGTIVERSDLPDWQADLDGDGKDDAVYLGPQTLGREAEVRIRCSSGSKAFLKLPMDTFFITVVDMDGDKVAEIVSVERLWWGDWRFLCWRYKNGRWLKNSSPKFNDVSWSMFGSDTYLIVSPRKVRELSLFRDEKGIYLLAVTKEGKQVKVWKVRWQKGKWTKLLMGEVSEPSKIKKISFIYAGQRWVVVGSLSPPKWQDWLWEKMGRFLQRFFPFLREPRERFFVYDWDGQRSWTLLGRWRKGNPPSPRSQLADMDGDGKWELAIAFPRRVLIAKFEDRRWRTVWVEVPFFKYHRPVRSFYGFRYGGKEWAIYQEEKSHHCIAITLEGRQ